MTGTFSTDNGEAVVAFSYKATTAVVLVKADKTAHYLWDRGCGDHGTEEEPILYTDLSNQQKLDIIDAYLLKSILDMAASYVADAADLDKVIAVAEERAIVLNNT